MEKQSTNLVLQSEDFTFTSGIWLSATGGGTASVSVTANYGISPDGTQNADRIQLNKGNTGYSEIYQLFSTTIGSTYTQTLWLKSLSGTPKINFGYTGSTRGTITLTTEWKRYEFTYVSGGNPNGVALTLFDGFDPSTAQSIDVLAWGAQAEASSYPTSYIPTTSASATRIADACYKTGISNLIGGGVGTWFMDFEMVVASTGTGNPFAFDLSDNSTSNRLFLYWSEAAQTWNWGGVDTSITLPSTLRKKIAVKYSSGTAKLFCNGSSISTLSISSAFTRLDIGQRFSNTFPMDGKINEAYFLTTSLTDAECISLTTL